MRFLEHYFSLIFQNYFSSMENETETAEHIGTLENVQNSETPVHDFFEIDTMKR